jgi:hypothetical protein
MVAALPIRRGVAALAICSTMSNCWRCGSSRHAEPGQKALYATLALLNYFSPTTEDTEDTAPTWDFRGARAQRCRRLELLAVTYVGGGHVARIMTPHLWGADFEAVVDTMRFMKWFAFERRRAMNR